MINKEPTEVVSQSIFATILPDKFVINVTKKMPYVIRIIDWVTWSHPVNRRRRHENIIA
jgi:hypothetical protein